MKSEEYKPKPLGTYISMHSSNIAQGMLDECTMALYKGKPLENVFNKMAIRYLKMEHEVQQLKYEIIRLKEGRSCEKI